MTGDAADAKWPCPCGSGVKYKKRCLPKQPASPPHGGRIVEHNGQTMLVTNWALGLVEAAQDMKELWRHVDRIAKAGEDYMPEGPPWSPITRSMFNAWSLFDLTVGVKRESLGSIAR